MPVDATSYHPAYMRQSRFTDPGTFAAQLDTLPDDLPSLKDAAHQLVFHYRAGGDWEENGIASERIAEIDTRYADRMFQRLFELSEQPLTETRTSNQRLVGCCRDFTVFLLAMARHKGIPARSRVGFARYFAPGWNLDHVVAEVWDDAGHRWRLVDAELEDGYIDPVDGTPLDPLDLPRDRFITGDRAWLACRAEQADPETFVIAPDLDIPNTRGWPYIAHNLIHDLAALNHQEMLLWDTWGMMHSETALMPDHLDLLDLLASTIDSPGSSPEERRQLYEHEAFRVPASVLSFSPASQDIPFTVDLSR